MPSADTGEGDIKITKNYSITMTSRKADEKDLRRVCDIVGDATDDHFRQMGRFARKISQGSVLFSCTHS